MERIGNTRQGGITSNGLHTWGMLFVAMGIIGRSIFQFRLVGMGNVTTAQLLEAMNASDDIMIFATAGLLLQAMETCAVPIFAYLLVEGREHTSDFMKYAMRVLGVAVLSEIPYNLAMSGKVLDFSTRNPMFGLVMAMIAIYFYGVYGEKNAKNTLIKLVVTAAAFLWAAMLKIEYGGCLVILTGVLWMYRKNNLMRNMAGATGALVCMLYSPLFMVAPMGMLAVHSYNGEKGKDNRLANYLAYPVLLTVVALYGMYCL